MVQLPPKSRVLQLMVYMGLAGALAGCETTSLVPATLGAAPATVHSEPPVEIYSRIARSALTCWFGSQGSLKKTHIFHADVAPEALGGGAEIVVHERDNAAENPRSFKAYIVVIAPAAGGSSLTAQNLRMPLDVAKEMHADVVRWAKGKPDCGTVIGIGGWAQQPQGSQAAPIATGSVKNKKAR